MKIYSFIPSATEMVYALGLGDQLCGVTHECDYPPDARTKPVAIRSLIDSSSLSQREIDDRVVESMTHGHGLYSIDKTLLRENKPDVVITQELCDVCSVSLRDVLATISDLSSSCEVVSLKPRGLKGVLEDILTVGRACSAETAAEELAASLEVRIEAVRERAEALNRPRVFCVEWFDPVFASGHWVPEMVKIAGGEDALGLAGQDSRKIAWDRVLAYDPEVLILMPCGFEVERAVEDMSLLARKDGWRSIAAVRKGTVFATNGSAYYSRPGPRLVDGLELMGRMIHPEAFGSETPPNRARRVGLEPPRKPQ
ncbi:MAG TPA: cobalamin-binding protein [Nitrososphaerales archaeon]|nr:cobalamin-binding protein [Nitrososphaerales archaeon]